MVKIILTKEDYIRASLLINTPVKQIIERLPYLKMANGKEYNYLSTTHKKKVYSIRDVSITYLKNDQEIILMPTTLYNKHIILAYAYLILTADEYNVRLFHDSIGRYLRTQEDYTAIIKALRDYNQKLLGIPVYSFNPISFKQLQKYARKCNATLEMVDDRIWITYKNVKVGDSEDGYISYSKVSIELMYNFYPSEHFIFYFKDFHYDSWWTFWRTPHPHISGSFCYGNREKDVTLYIDKGAFPLLFALYRELLESYNPDGAYNGQKIPDIVRTINQFRRLMASIKLTHLNEPLSIGKELFHLVSSNTIRCGGCGSFTTPELGCLTAGCLGNMSSAITCSEGHRMKLGNWNEERRVYDWVCDKCVNQNIQVVGSVEELIDSLDEEEEDIILNEDENER